MRLRGGAPECGFWNIFRGKKAKLDCANGTEFSNCNICDLNLCSEHCKQHHVCHVIHDSYDDCTLDPIKMLRWMFDRLNASIKSIFENSLVKSEYKCSHNLCDLFKTDDAIFTGQAIQYWIALKSVRVIKEMFANNCRIDFINGQQGMQLTFSKESTFTLSIFNTICDHIRVRPFLHLVLRERIDQV
jgi:hypothetical protein